MKQRIGILVVVMVAAWMGVAAQSLSVTDFKPLPNDLTANMAGTQVKDQNGEVAALIKVVTTQTGFTFEGGMAGIVKTLSNARVRYGCMCHTALRKSRYCIRRSVCCATTIFHAPSRLLAPMR